MMPDPRTPGWFLMPLRPTRYAPAKIARLKVVDGKIVHAFALEKRSAAIGSPHRLHWAAGLGSWAEVA